MKQFLKTHYVILETGYLQFKSLLWSAIVVEMLLTLVLMMTLNGTCIRAHHQVAH